MSATAEREDGEGRRVTIVAYVILVPLMAFGLAILLGVVKWPTIPADYVPEPGTYLHDMEQVREAAVTAKREVIEAFGQFAFRLWKWIKGGAW